MLRNNLFCSLSCTTMFIRCCGSCSFSATIVCISKLVDHSATYSKASFVFKTSHYNFSVHCEQMRRRYISLTHILLDTHPFTNLTIVTNCCSCFQYRFASSCTSRLPTSIAFSRSISGACLKCFAIVNEACIYVLLFLNYSL